MDNTTETVNILSYCTGYGGLEIALDRIIPKPMRVIAVEIEAYAQANLVAKAEKGDLAIDALYSNVKTFPARAFRGCFDWLVAGYPCQPFSCAGKRQGTSDPRHLWPTIRKHVSRIRPVFCAFENVSGHVSMGYDQVYKDLRSLGYNVEAGLFTAEEVGAPHRRERLFILAYSESVRRTGRDYIQDMFGQRQIQKLAKKEQSVVWGNASGCSDGELANCSGQRIQRCWAKGQQEFQTHAQEKISLCDGRGYPARPNQQQYDWEEPRTIKPSLGRTIHGFASRVDELRLLGNGIVPDQAEFAIRYLLEKAGLIESFNYS